MKKTIIIVAIIIIVILLGVALAVGLVVIAGGTRQNPENQISNVVDNTQENPINEQHNSEASNNEEENNFNINEPVSNIEEPQNSVIENNDGSKSYDFGGVTFTFGNEWTLSSLVLLEQTYDSLENTNENLTFICMGGSDFDTDSDYTQENVRQELYNSFSSFYEGLPITGNGSFELIKDNIYCAYFDVNQESLYAKTYTILDTQKNKYCSCMVTSQTPFTTEQTEKIQTIINTVQF